MMERAKVLPIAGVVVAAAAAVVGLAAYLWPHQPPDFAVSLSPENVAVQAGGNTATQITVEGRHGFVRQITLSASGQPDGLVVSLTPSRGVTNPRHVSAATITVGRDVAAGPYPIKIKATSDSGDERSADLDVVVSQPPKPVVGPLHPPEVKIDTPANGGTVKSDSEIAGVITGQIPDGWYMWVLLNPRPSPGQYWPQGAAIVPFGGKWQTQIHVGRAEDKGMKFDLWVYLVDSSLNERYTQWVAEGTRSKAFPPLPSPPSDKGHVLQKRLSHLRSRRTVFWSRERIQPARRAKISRRMVANRRIRRRLSGTVVQYDGEIRGRPLTSYLASTVTKAQGQRGILQADRQSVFDHRILRL